MRPFIAAPPHGQALHLPTRLSRAHTLGEGSLVTRWPPAAHLQLCTPAGAAAALTDTPPTGERCCRLEGRMEQRGGVNPQARCAEGRLLVQVCELHLPRFQPHSPGLDRMVPEKSRSVVQTTRGRFLALKILVQARISLQRGAPGPPPVPKTWRLRTTPSPSLT